MLTVQTQIGRRRMRRLISVFTVPLKNALLKLEKMEKIPLNTPKNVSADSDHAASHHGLHCFRRQAGI